MLHLRRGSILAIGVALIALIALADWQIEFNATLGFLYMFPLVLLATVLDWKPLLVFALFCAFLSDRLDPFPMDAEYARDLLIFLTLAITALLARGLTNGYRREMANHAQIEREVAARRAAEEQLEFLIESSPAAVLTMTAEGEILLANPAAHQMLRVPADALPGRSIARYIPELGSIPSITEGSVPESAKSGNMFRTEMQTHGRRETGEVFLANVFFSTYRTAAGPRLAALLIDTSEHLREREEASLQQLLEGSRILVAAVSHEVRNVCGAIGIVHENLARQRTLAGNQDFEALGSLVETLAKIASLELRQSTAPARASRVNLQEVLGDLRIVLESACEDSEIDLRWSTEEDLPLVQADRHSLLQVLLNLTKNSQRALESTSNPNLIKRLEIHTSTSFETSNQSLNPPPANQRRKVLIRVIDNGPGVTPGTQLFQPLQKGADATGLGLYLSRAFMRSFHGDLRHEPTPDGCHFVLELVSVTE